MVSAKRKSRARTSGCDRQGKGHQRQGEAFVSSSASSIHTLHAACILTTWSDSEMSSHWFMQGISFSEWKVVWDHVAAGKNLSDLCLFSVGYRQGQPFADTVETGKGTLCHVYICPSKLLSKEGWTWCWWDCIAVAMLQQCWQSSNLFDSASGPSKMEKGLFWVLWFGCRKANGWAALAKEGHFESTSRNIQ